MKLMVNLQITAMLAIFEFTYSLAYMLLFRYYSKGSSFATLIQGMALYLVFLPFSFLMNTTHNKYRIVEIGWKNVFKNIVRGWISHVMRIFPFLQSDNRISPVANNHNSTAEIAQTTIDSHDHPRRQPKDKKKKARRKSSKNTSQAQSKCEVSKIGTQQETRNGDDGIYIISTSRELSNSKTIENEASDPNVPFSEEPSTSYPENSQFVNHITSDDESSILPNPNETNSTREHAYQAVAQNIVQIMKDSLEHENLYLDYFTKLLELKENMSNVNVVEILSMEQLFNISEDENWRERNNVELKGSKSTRNEMRNELLNKLELSYQLKENTFDLLISELIDLEEHFINDC